MANNTRRQVRELVHLLYLLHILLLLHLLLLQGA